MGRNRAEACREKLQELNTGVAVHAASGELTDAFVRQFQVVVATTAPLAEAKRLDALCHAAGTAFIWAQTRGVFARVFTDFGPAFTVYDVNGEEPHSGIVASVSSGSPAMVTCVEDERLEFQVGCGRGLWTWGVGGGSGGGGGVHGVGAAAADVQGVPLARHGGASHTELRSWSALAAPSVASHYCV